MSLPTILVFASGTKDGGGSGLRKLILAIKSGLLKAEIVGVVSNNSSGGASQIAAEFGIPFVHQTDFAAEEYQRIAEHFGADFFALSGWLKLVRGLDLNTRFNPRTVFNIHPGPLPRFGGKGMHGEHVHEAVMKAYECNECTHSCVTMHFVTDEYDQGPTFFRFHVPVLPGDTAETLGKRVNMTEHEWQPKITNMVVHGEISWDGENPASLSVPAGYQIDHHKLYWDRP